MHWNENRWKSCLLSSTDWIIYVSSSHAQGTSTNFETIAKRRRKGIKFTTQPIGEDLKIWIEFLESPKDGISINRNAIRKPTTIIFSDSSELGFGWYTPLTWAYCLEMWTCQGIHSQLQRMYCSHQLSTWILHESKSKYSTPAQPESDHDQEI